VFAVVYKGPFHILVKGKGEEKQRLRRKGPVKEKKRRQAAAKIAALNAGAEEVER